MISKRSISPLIIVPSFHGSQSVEPHAIFMMPGRSTALALTSSLPGVNRYFMP